MIKNKAKIVCIIPARGGSKRLSRKNLYKINNKPCIHYAIKACLDSEYIKDFVYVTSEDREIIEYSLSQGAKIIERPVHLSKDNVWTQDVLKHAVNHLSEEKFTHVIRVQANSPQVTTKKINECIEKLVKYNLWEVFTVDDNGIEDAAIHVMKKDCVFQNALSVYKGVVTTNYIDLHTLADVIEIENRMKND